MVVGGGLEPPTQGFSIYQHVAVNSHEKYDFNKNNKLLMLYTIVNIVIMGDVNCYCTIIAPFLLAVTRINTYIYTIS